MACKANIDLKYSQHAMNTMAMAQLVQHMEIQTLRRRTRAGEFLEFVGWPREEEEVWCERRKKELQMRRTIVALGLR